MIQKLNMLLIMLTFSVSVSAQTIYEIISASPVHTTLKAAVDAAGLDVALDDPSISITAFAPDDAAFAALPPGTLEDLLEDPQGLLTEILLYHAVDGIAASTDLFDGQVITTLQGQDVTVTINADGVFINDAEVTGPDINASNGILHVVDAVLLPSFNFLTVYDIIEGSPDHEILEAAILAAGLETALQDDTATLTVFAPTDAAFAALPPGTIEALLEDPQGLLTDILLYHVVGVEAFSADLFDGQVITTLLGQDVRVTINADGVFINDAEVIVADLPAVNGVVHVIDAVLIPAVSNTIYDIISSSPDHTILTAAVDAAGADVALSDDGIDITLFAPTDEAFAALPPGTIEALLEDPEGLLSDILAYHVLLESFESSELFDGQVIATALGQDVTVTINGDGVFINDAKVIIADLLASNGVVHVIDAVLLPAVNTNTVYDIISNSPVHTILTTAIDLAGFQDILSSDELSFTVFAPTDAAFQALPPEIIEQLIGDPEGLLAKALRYHVVFGTALSTDLLDGQTITTALGQDITVTINQDGVFINDAQVLVADIEGTNGVVHVVDAVLFPALTVYDVINESPVHTTLATAIDLAGLDEALQGEGPFTVFAPTNAAFDALPAGVLEALLADPTGDLTKVLTYHVLGGEFLSADIREETMLTTLNGQTVEITLDGADILVNNARIIISNVETFNGVVHVIDAVLVPDLSSVRNVNLVDLQVMPNPAGTHTFVSMPEAFLNKGVQATLQTMTGQFVRTWVVSNTVEQVDLSTVPAGSYILTIQSGDQTGRSLIIKQ
jgi:transforming growth factor-beta-induced protein